MTLALRAMPVALLSASCGLTTDFTPEPDTGTGPTASASTNSSTSSAGGGPGAGGEATTSSEASGAAGGLAEGGGGGDAGGTSEGGGGSGGAPPTPEGAVSLFRSGTQGGLVEVRSLAIDADGTAWIGGWFTGDALKHGTVGGDEVTVVTGDGARITTFVAGVDPGGVVVHAFAVARSSVDDGGDSIVGVRLQVADDGSIFLVSSVRDGSIRLDGVSLTAANHRESRLVVARVSPNGVDADATTEWAAACRGSIEYPDGEGTTTSPSDLDARRSSLALLDVGTLALATSFSAVDTVTCTTLVTTAAEPCGIIPVTLDGAVVIPFDQADGGCAATPVLVSSEGGVVTVDDMVVQGESGVLLTGQVFSTQQLLPWQHGISDGAPHAFAGALTLEGDPGEVVDLPSLGFGAFAARDGTFVSASPSGDPEEGTFPAGDVLVKRGDTELALGDPEDSTSTEVATDVDVEGDGVLITGYLTEEATLAEDLCGDECGGDLVDADVCAATPAFPDTDAYWLYLPRGEHAPGDAVGRSFGGCGRQKLVAGALTAESILLVAQLDGNATLDLLDAQVIVDADATRRTVALVRIVRPEDER